jgi:DMSO/TMAO reductase YedYZ molybdopterin-dependent catalytic subunit
VVSKNPPGFDPALNGDTWVLQIDGLVARPSKLSLPQLRALPAVEQLQTLECISNEVGGDLISNAKWKGVRVRDLLARAGGVGANAVKVAFHCADGYTEAIPVVDAMMPTTLLAYEMNGEPLPAPHGFPARLLVPGLFGMKNPKWIRRIEVVDYDFQGYWERSGWSDEAVVKTMSRITTLERTHPLREIPVGGVAYAGDRRIKEVEYSVDAGKTWQKAEVKPALGPFTWVLWAAVWAPAGPGEYTVKVRAKDGNGVLQTAKEARTLPDGASGYHTLRVRVRK